MMLGDGRVLNREKLEHVLTWIKDHPELHDQSVWAREADCGTTACFAGWTLLLEKDDLGTPVYATVNDFDLDHRLAFERTKSPRVGVSVPSEAARLLGLTYEQHTVLFYGADTLDEVERTVKAIMNGVDDEDELMKECKGA